MPRTPYIDESAIFPRENFEKLAPLGVLGMNLLEPWNGPRVSALALSLAVEKIAAGCAFIFVGSYNWDPRSSFLNTEMGLSIDSPPLAELAAKKLASRLSRGASRRFITESFLLRESLSQRLLQYFG